MVGGTLLPGQARIWSGILRGYKPPTIERAFVEHLRRSPFMPKPVEILSLIDELAEKAWHDREFSSQQTRQQDAKAANADWETFAKTSEGETFLREITERSKRIDRVIAQKVVEHDTADRRAVLLQQARSLGSTINRKKPAARSSADDGRRKTNDPCRLEANTA